MVPITLENLKNTFEHSFIRFDKKGEEHYDTISAFIKSMRAGDADAAIYYLARMIEGGEDPKFIARRMVVFASEDIGLAHRRRWSSLTRVSLPSNISACPNAVKIWRTAWPTLPSPPKTAVPTTPICPPLDDVKKTGNLPIPLKIRNAPTKLMKDLNYGKGYKEYDKESLLPDKLKGKKYLKRRK